MAKYVTFGSIIKGKEGAADYIKISKDVKLEDGQYVNLKAPKKEIERIEKLLDDGKISQDVAQKLIGRLEKIQDFVRFELEVKLED